MKKRVLSMLLASAMVLPMALSGCGKNGDDGGPDANGNVTLTWALPFSVQKDYDQVMGEANKLLAELMPGTQLKFMMDTSMADKWSLWMAGKTPIDIALSGYSNPLADQINKKSYKELDALIDQYAPTIKAEREQFPDLYQTGVMNDKLYAIPNIQIYINTDYGIRIPNKYAEFLDVAALQEAAKNSPTTTEATYKILDDYLNKVFAQPGVKGDYVIEMEYTPDRLSKRGFEFLGSNSSALCYRPFAGTDKVEVLNFYETEEFSLWTKYARKWFEKGYISKDVLTGGSASANEILSSNVYNFTEGDDDGDGVMVRSDKNAAGETIDYLFVNLTPESQKYRGTSVTGSNKVYCSIPATSKNPEKAMQLLELLRTEKGAPLLNMLVYGLEGTHYDKTSDTEIKPRDYAGQGVSNSAYGIPNWMMGTHFNMYVVYPYTEKTRTAANEYFKNRLPSYTKTPVYGLTINNSGLENDLAQIDSAVTEYKTQLTSGMFAEHDKNLANMLKKLKAAGLDEVKSNYQAQIDAYIAK